jgi:hypothetical protein
MISSDLKDIKIYWSKKYPTVDVLLYSNEEENKFFGKMIAHNVTFNLQADTVGELINQGESFLRNFMK